MSNRNIFLQSLFHCVMYGMLLGIVEIILINYRGRWIFIAENWFARTTLGLGIIGSKIFLVTAIFLLFWVAIFVLKLNRKMWFETAVKFGLVFCVSLYLGAHYTMRFLIPHGYEISPGFGFLALIFSMLIGFCIVRVPSWVLKPAMPVLGIGCMVGTLGLFFLSQGEAHGTLHQPRNDTGLAGMIIDDNSRMNVVYVVSDAMAQSHLHAYGYHRENTPFLEKFRKESVVFERFRAVASATSSSTASLFTGKYPGNNGTHDRQRLPSEQVTAAEYFRSFGYHTVLISANVRVSAAFNMDQGFDEVFFENSAQGSWLVEQFAGVISRISDRPLFVYLHFMETHTPYLLEDRFLNVFMDDSLVSMFPAPFRVESSSRYGGDLGDPSPGHRWPTQGHYVALYDAAILQMDHYFGRVVEVLRKEKIYDNTIVGFSSDHGEFMGDWNLFCTHGSVPYVDQVDVPFLLKYDGSHLRIQSLFENRQVFRMILDLIGTRPRGEDEITDLIDSYAGEVAISKKGENLEYSEGFAIEDRNFKYIFNPRGLALQSMFQFPHLIWPWKVRELAISETYFQYLYEEQFFRVGRETELLGRHPEKSRLRSRLMRDIVRVEDCPEKPRTVDDATKRMLESLGYIQ